MVVLEQGGRIPHGGREERLDILVNHLIGESADPAASDGVNGGS
ncbi:hypothetical protein ACFOSC_11135 [Streptantibioticus rubrisoli]|nr:hypothetical protein [Streptantibioticus rubrisoli]